MAHIITAHLHRSVRQNIAFYEPSFDAPYSDIKSADDPNNIEISFINPSTRKLCIGEYTS